MRFTTSFKGLLHKHTMFFAKQYTWM